MTKLLVVRLRAMEIAIAVIVGLVTVPLIAWLGRRSGKRAVDALGPLAPGAVTVVAFMTGAVVTALRRFDPSIPRFSPLADRLFTGRVLVVVADSAHLVFWRSGREPQLLARLPIDRLVQAGMVPEGLRVAMHLALQIADADGLPVTIPLVVHGASTVKGRPGPAGLQAVAAALLALRTSR